MATRTRNRVLPPMPPQYPGVWSNDEAKQTAAEAVATKVSWRIMVQDYPPGHRLREQELSAEYDVSRTVIRDVIGKLSARGFLEIHPRRGATVVQYSVEELSDLLTLNGTVYGMVAKLAAERRTEEDLKRMEEALKEMQRKSKETNTTEEFHVCRVKFFGAMNHATGPFYTGRQRANFPMTFYHQYVLLDAITLKLRLHQVKFFTELLEHLRNQDADAARICAENNFSEKRDIILEALQTESVA